MGESVVGAQPLTTELRRLGGQPFGLDGAGQPIRHGSGKLVAGAIQYLDDVVGERTARALPTVLPERDRAARIAAARDEARQRLVAMLNAAIEDDRHHVTLDFLLNEGNSYSYEFRLFVADYCRVISGDPDFFFNQGARDIPKTLAHLGRRSACAAPMPSSPA